MLSRMLTLQDPFQGFPFTMTPGVWVWVWVWVGGWVGGPVGRRVGVGELYGMGLQQTAEGVCVCAGTWGKA
jgi:hypothetical protein